VQRPPHWPSRSPGAPSVRAARVRHSAPEP
jgi:hypothetical protein